LLTRIIGKHEIAVSSQISAYTILLIRGFIFEIKVKKITAIPVTGLGGL
jgi:hypothetical protein